MMKSNIDIVKKLYLAFYDLDFVTAGELMHPQIIWEQMKGFPGGRTYVGASAVIDKLMKSFNIIWEYWYADTEDFYSSGNTVFVKGTYCAKHRVTGKCITVGFMHEYAVENNQLVYFRQYTDTYLIQEAMTK